RYYEQFAVNEFLNLFNEATGEKLQALTDSAVTVNENSKYIFIGYTKQAEEKQVSAPTAVYTNSGYVIKTIDNSIYIVGGSERGTLFGIYRLLEYILDYDYYYQNVYSLNKNVRDIQLMEYDVKVIPDFEYNTFTNSATRPDNSEEKYSMNGKNDYGPLVGHRSMYYVPVEQYLLVDESSPDYHPMWYMTNSKNEFPRDEAGEIVLSGNGGVTQLCYTAHGIESEFKALGAAVAEQFKKGLKSDPKLNQFHFGMSDDRNWCECSACDALLQKYGTPASSVIIFLNYATGLIDEWFETEEGKPYKRQFDVYFYAYFDCEVAPSYYDESAGKYLAIDEETKCDVHVVPQIAIMQSDMSASIHDEINKYTKDMYHRWMPISDRLASYVYVGRYEDYISPYNTINDMQTLYRFLKDCNVVLALNLGTPSENSGYPTGWAALKVYLAAKLGIDVDIDVSYYINKYFKNVYGVAGDTMKKFFDEYRAVDEYNQATFSNYAGLNAYWPHNKDAKYFSRANLERWRGYVNTALTEIEYMKEFDPARYEATKMMVLGERLWLDYFYYYIYKEDFTEEELAVVKKELADLLVYTNTSVLKEAPIVSVEVLLKELRG
ncbi:MAG: DUF4838 domain-containing protein, partial [Clostridia bacterium]|nr:DUF4838 domain-containing protein [Clostridia bacterium]